MNILYIWDADYPWDVRVEKICTSLMTFGNDIHIAARNLKKLPTYEEIEGLHIHRMKIWKNKSINYLLSFPAFISPIWYSFLESIVRENDIELIIVRDLPMSIAGIWVGKRKSIPVVFDMAEDYVAMLWDIWKARKFKGLNLLVRNPYLAMIIEKYVFANTDHILVVVDEARDLIVRKGGVFERITIVGNTPKIESLRGNILIMNADLEKISNHFSVIYTGGVQMGRGIQTVLEAIPSLLSDIPEFMFVVVGEGYALSRLKELAKKMSIDDHVMWIGWVHHERLYDYIRVSKLGIIPHLATDHVNTTIPNKIFDYMGLGLPVVASNASPMVRILKEEGCGLTFKSGDSNDLTIKIKEIYHTNKDYGSRGIDAVIKKYNWCNDEKRLLDVIKMYSRK